MARSRIVRPPRRTVIPLMVSMGRAPTPIVVANARRRRSTSASASPSLRSRSTGHRAVAASRAVAGAVGPGRGQDVGEEAQQVAEALGAVVGHVGPGPAMLGDGAAHDPPQPHARRPIEPDQEVGPRQPARPGAAVAALEDPALAGFGFKAQARLLGPGPLDPAWLPVDTVDVDHRQAGNVSRSSWRACFFRSPAGRRS